MELLASLSAWPRVHPALAGYALGAWTGGPFVVLAWAALASMNADDD